MKPLNQELLDRLEALLDVLSIDIDLDYSVYKGVCPIHYGADNRTAFNINLETGRWKCFTHKCHLVFQGNLIGLVRGILSKNQGWQDNGDTPLNFDETLKFITDFIRQDFPISKRKFASRVKKISFQSGTLTRIEVRDKLFIPSTYFLKRGFTEKALDDFDVGDCKTFPKRMYARAVVPVYGFDNRVIGCTGRSLYKECPKCKLHHPKKKECPDKHLSFYSKWLHSKGFNRQNWLYNIERASKSVRETGTIIIVESPPNVIRLAEAGIENAVALFGSAFTSGQKFLIDNSGALNLVLALDNDASGQETDEFIRTQCNKTYRIQSVKLPKNDVAECTVEETKRIFLPILENL